MAQYQIIRAKLATIGAQESGGTPTTDQNTLIGAGKPLSPYTVIAVRALNESRQVAGAKPGMAINGAGAKAIATSLTNAMVAGLVPRIENDPGGLLDFITTGLIEMDNWESVTDGETGLIANTYYYLSPIVAGNLTSTKPTTAGQIVIRLGLAISSIDFIVQIGEPTIVPGG